MLTLNLLVTRKRKNTIKPAFKEKNRENLELAESLINLFRSAVKSNLDEVEGVYREIEETYRGDYRFPRGLYALLERRTTAEPPVSVTSPFLIRQIVFDESNRLHNGSVLTQQDKQKVYNEAARRLSIPEKDVESGLWADEEPVIKEFDPITPDELISTYNLSLMQTLLFNATVLEVWLDPNTERLKEILRFIRYYGLMYDASKTVSGYHLVIDGPVSTLKFTGRYGTSLAKFLPHLLENKEWMVKATIKEKTRVYDFTLDKNEFTPYHHSTGPANEGPAFDSKVEENFYRQFNALNTRWTLKREPEPLIAEYVMFPDFGFEGYNQTLYMEIMGYWTPEYLKKKIKKVETIKNVKFILCVNQELECSPKKLKGVDVVYYKKNIPLKQILDLLKTYEEKNMAEDAEALEKEFNENRLTGKIVTAEELSKQHKVSAESMKKHLQQKQPRGYDYTGNLLIPTETIKKLKQQIERLYQQAGTYGEAQEAIRKHIPEEHVPEVFNHLGYEVEWKTLNPDDSPIQRKKERPTPL